jgi:hypothetical protein
MNYKDLIDQFEAGGAKVKAVIAGLSRDELLARPVAGMWSIQEVVVHLQDADAVCVDRLRRIIAEETPLLIGFDENLFIKNLFYDDQSAADAAEALDITRRQFARVLRKLPDAAWSRAGVHNERGKITLGEMLESYTKHLEGHVKFAQEKRQKLGK